MFLAIILTILIGYSLFIGVAQADGGFANIGVAQVDITPDYPIRLSGYGGRRTESEGVTQQIWAKALAIDDTRPGTNLALGQHRHRQTAIRPGDRPL